MPKLIIAFASATLLLASSGIWKANAATVTTAGTLAPLTKSYAPAEKVGYYRRYGRRYAGQPYRRDDGYGYGYPHYGYSSLPILRLRLQAVRLLRLRLETKHHHRHRTRLGRGVSCRHGR